jgi:hypothetical protein
VAPFADPRVGCTTGRLAWLDAGRTETSRNEGAYWRYEQAVRRLESQAGWLTAVTGALLAVRRSCYREVPAHASMDSCPCVCARPGADCLAVPDAVAAIGVAGLRDQFGTAPDGDPGYPLQPLDGPPAGTVAWPSAALAWSAVAARHALLAGLADRRTGWHRVARRLPVLVTAGPAMSARSVGRLVRRLVAGPRHEPRWPSLPSTSRSQRLAERPSGRQSGLH